MVQYRGAGDGYHVSTVELRAQIDQGNISQLHLA